MKMMGYKYHYSNNRSDHYQTAHTTMQTSHTILHTHLECIQTAIMTEGDHHHHLADHLAAETHARIASSVDTGHTHVLVLHVDSVNKHSQQLMNEENTIETHTPTVRSKETIHLTRREETTVVRAAAEAETGVKSIGTTHHTSVIGHLVEAEVMIDQHMVIHLHIQDNTVNVN